MRPPTDKEIICKLNRLWKTNMDEYIRHVEVLKGTGYRIFRNENGEHRLSYNNNYLNEVFGGVFCDIFGGPI